jgi:glutamyl-tRNA synthetase
VVAEPGEGQRVRVRFAPSPTGYLHVGSARTALFNWLFARQQGGDYLLRIEDTDTERNRQEWSDGIITTLDWLGIPPDEPAIYQSSRAEDHQQAIEQLWEAGLVYACDCAREEVDARTKGNAIPGYDGYCRDRNVSRQGNALRFRVPDSGTIIVHDLIHGDVEFPLNAIEDFVIVKSNGSPLFVLANVVDDRSMRITHVIRGDDLLPSAPKALLVWAALDETAKSVSDGAAGSGGGVPLPAYAHLPMLVDQNGRKIGKRFGDVSVEAYRAEGFLPAGFSNYLALLGWGHPEGEEIFDIGDAASASLENVHKSPAFFDVAKLRHVNAEHLRALSAEQFIRASMPWMIAEAEALQEPVFEAMTPGGAPWPEEHFDPEAFRRIAPHVQQRISVLKEVPPMVDFLFFTKPVIDQKDWDSIAGDAESKAILDEAISRYEVCEFDPETLHAVTAEVAESVGRKLAKAQAPIRVSITGKRVGPPLFESMAILGREKVLERLRAGRARLDKS